MWRLVRMSLYTRRLFASDRRRGNFLVLMLSCPYEIGTPMARSCWHCACLCRHCHRGRSCVFALSPGVPSDVPAESGDTAVYTCGETTVVAIFSGDEATLTFSDVREANVLYPPPSPGSEAEGSPWKRYASPDGFVFWRSSDVAFFEQNGATLYGECKA